MIQTTRIDLGNGSLEDGFPDITIKLRKSDGYPSELKKLQASLPPASHLVSVYQKWKSLYSLFLENRFLTRKSGSSDNSNIDDSTGINIDSVNYISFSEEEFTNVCFSLKQELNKWLEFEDFNSQITIIRKYIDPNIHLQLIISTEDNIALKLPWNIWDFLAEDYPNAELVVGLPEDKLSRNIVNNIEPSKDNKLRILAIFGNSEGINLSEDKKLIRKFQKANLNKKVEVKLIEKPNFKKVKHELEKQKWDILFFSGHSSSLEGERNLGWDFWFSIIKTTLNKEFEVLKLILTTLFFVHPSLEDLDDNNYSSKFLTVNHLKNIKESFKKAVKKGLKLAIFNSCDGIQLGNYLMSLGIPQTIIMREVVPDFVAHNFLKYFLAVLFENISLSESLSKIRLQLKELETHYPCASWLPVIFQGQDNSCINWQDFKQKESTNLSVNNWRKKLFFPLPSLTIVGTVLVLASGLFCMGKDNDVGLKLSDISNSGIEIKDSDSQNDYEKKDIANLEASLNMINSALKEKNSGSQKNADRESYANYSTISRRGYVYTNDIEQKLYRMVSHKQGYEREKYINSKNKDVKIENYSESKNYFFVREDNGVPRTYLRTRQEPIPFIEWSSLYFAESGYPPEVRATQVTERIAKYFRQCSGLKITHTMVPGNNGGEIPIVKAVDNEEGCNGLVYTLKSELDGEQTVIYLVDALEQAFKESSEASASPRQLRRE